MSHPLASLAVVIVLSIAGCHHSDRPSGGATRADARTPSDVSASTQPSSFTGTLRGSAVAVGGETTGWRLAGDNQTGAIDVDVSRVQQQARALDGKRVTVTGRMTSRSWPERGVTQVLVADRIEPAPQPGPAGAR